MYTDESGKTLCDAVEDLVMAWPGVSRKTTFGYPSYVADGVLFAVVSEQGLSLTRLTDAERARLERSLAVEPFDTGGRLVRRWATVRVDHPEDAPVERALRQSYEAAVV
ncbi:TfoX/Sxy family protein [Salinigranum halophilum]|jgi:hypothetical protein|uniref:TfoX/Sxy family protein n=1 Tax=Salinigranum halophilum TaxID=2565931 RepID=UPI00115E1E2C|nr:TfoX/Sxy family protein [Salinigranum halophilum]